MKKRFVVLFFLFIAAARFSQPERKEHRQAEPECGPAERFLETNDVRAPVKNPEVERQKNQHAADEHDVPPVRRIPQMRVHRVVRGEGRRAAPGWSCRA